MDNARLYEDSVSRATELDQRSQRLSTLNRFTTALTGLLDAEHILNLTADELLKGLGVRRVSVVTFERGQAYWKVSAPRTRIKLPKPLPDAPIFSRLRESLGVFNTDDARSEPDLADLAEMLGENTTALLILPLASEGNLTALIFAQMTGESRFGINELEVARTYQPGYHRVENARLYQPLSAAERFPSSTNPLISASLTRRGVCLCDKGGTPSCWTICDHPTTKRRTKLTLSISRILEKSERAGSLGSGMTAKL